jgi:hypothetical protein
MRRESKTARDFQFMRPYRSLPDTYAALRLARILGMYEYLYI